MGFLFETGDQSATNPPSKKGVYVGPPIDKKGNPQYSDDGSDEENHVPNTDDETTPQDMGQEPEKKKKKKENIKESLGLDFESTKIEKSINKLICAFFESLELSDIVSFVPLGNTSATTFEGTIVRIMENGNVVVKTNKENLIMEVSPLFKVALVSNNVHYKLTKKETIMEHKTYDEETGYPIPAKKKGLNEVKRFALVKDFINIPLESSTLTEGRKTEPIVEKELEPEVKKKLTESAIKKFFSKLPEKYY